MFHIDSTDGICWVTQEISDGAWEVHNDYMSIPADLKGESSHVLMLLKGSRKLEEGLYQIAILMSDKV